MSKGIVSRDEYFFKNYTNTKADIFYNFLILIDEKIKLKILACSFEITY